MTILPVQFCIAVCQQYHSQFSILQFWPPIVHMDDLLKVSFFLEAFFPQKLGYERQGGGVLHSDLIEKFEFCVVACFFFFFLIMVNSSPFLQRLMICHVLSCCHREKTTWSLPGNALWLREKEAFNPSLRSFLLAFS